MKGLYPKALVWSKSGQVQFTYLLLVAMATDVKSDGVWDTDSKDGMPAHLVYRGRKTPETEAEFIKRAAEGGASVGALKPDTPAIPAGTPYQVRLVSELEAFQSGCRCFREAYALSGAVLSVDMTAARGIHMGRIRKKRDKELVRLDVEYIKADETGNTTLKSEIAAKKQRLRDLPQTFDLTTATTATELDSLWPTELPR